MKNLIRQIYHNLKNSKMFSYEIGKHEFDNTWISYDIEKLAQNCLENNFMIIGYTYDIIPKGPDIGNIGIVCEDLSNGRKFWCHMTDRYIQRMLKMYEDENK